MVRSWWFMLAIVWSWQDHGMVIIRYSMIMAWPSWRKACSCYGHHGHYYNVVRTLIIKPTLFIIPLVVARYFLTRNMLNEPIFMGYPKDLQLKWILFPKNSKLSKIKNSCNKYVILKVSLNMNLLSGYHRREVKCAV